MFGCDAAIVCRSGIPLYGKEKISTMIALSRANPRPDQSKLPFAKRSSRPALTYLVLLAVADRGIAERLLWSDDAAAMHPHYLVHLDDDDCETLAAIRTRSNTVEEFLSGLAAVADGAAP
jgi:hypothetical protein